MQTYFIHTFGCQMNKADSERIASYLEACGLKPVRRAASADLVVLTTCGVRQSAEDRVYGLVANIRRENPDSSLVITGCLSERADVIKRLGKQVDVWLPIVELPELAGRLGLAKADGAEDYLSIKPKYLSSVSAFVPIGRGCDNFCAYCVVPYARHREKYRPHQEIISEIQDLLAAGYKEITLIAQNVNSYQDGLVGFPDLLRLAGGLPGDYWVRFATSHPKDMSDDLIGVLAANPKLCNYIHLPAQAGNNEVLERMNRAYTAEHYLDKVRKIRQLLPVVGLSTDIIVGFPGESRKQFEDTAELCRQAKFDMAYIARYSPRPGTAAFALADDVSMAEKKRREKELMSILCQSARENGQAWLGRETPVLVEGRNRKGEYYGKTETFKSVRIRTKRKGLSGSFVNVRISKVEDFGWEGNIAGASVCTG